MTNLLKRHRGRVFLALAVFAVLLLNAVGVFELIFELDTGATTFPAIARTPEFLVLVAVGVVLCLGLPALSPIPASLLTVACTLPVIWLGLQVPARRPLIPMEYSLLTILLLFVVHVLTSLYQETRRKERLVEAFGQYVPPELARRIGRDPEHLTMRAEARELSVMFCDIEGFTAIAERLEPRALGALLDDVLSPITRIIHRHHGTIDKYMGDAVMAFWGAPVPDPHHAVNAVSAAFEIQEELVGLRKRLAAEGRPEIHVGIGINTGLVSVGNMGTEYRVAYTVIGDAVNLAARLQQLTRIYRARILVGEATRKAFPAATYRELGLVQVKGKDTLTRIFEPCNPAIDPESTIAGNLHRHNEALACYYARRWARARELFLRLKAASPEDPLYDYYLERIAYFERRPPPEDWRGEIRYSVG